MTYQEELRIERTKRELQSELCAAVRRGEMTDIEANEWFNMKCEQWKDGLG